jgi:hypothetical protein
MSGRSFEDIVRGCGGSAEDFDFFDNDQYHDTGRTEPSQYYHNHEHGQYYMQPVPDYEYEDIEQGTYDAGVYTSENSYTT